MIKGREQPPSVKGSRISLRFNGKNSEYAKGGTENTMSQVYSGKNLKTLRVGEDTRYLRNLASQMRLSPIWQVPMKFDGEYGIVP